MTEKIIGPEIHRVSFTVDENHTPDSIRVNLYGHPWIDAVYERKIRGLTPDRELIVRYDVTVNRDAVNRDESGMNLNHENSPKNIASTIMEIGWGWYSPDPDDAEKFVMTRDSSHLPSPRGNRFPENSTVPTERKTEMKNTEFEILASMTGPQMTMAVLAVNSASLRGSPKPVTEKQIPYLKSELIFAAVNDLVNSGVLNEMGFATADSIVQNLAEDLAATAVTDPEDRTQNFLDEMKNDPVGPVDDNDDDAEFVETKTEPDNCGICGGSMADHDDMKCQIEHGGPDAGLDETEVEILILKKNFEDSAFRQGQKIETLETRIEELEGRVVRYSLRIADLKNSVQVMKISSDEIAGVAENLYQAAQGILIDKRIPASRKSEIETAVRGYEFKS